MTSVSDTNESEYIKLSEVDHIIQRPDMYTGELANKEKQMFMYDPESNKIYYDSVTYNTGILKMFDEILINAVDNYQRTKSKGIRDRTTWISVDIGISDDFFDDIGINDTYIKITNNGESIPIQKTTCKTEDGEKEMYIPQMIFTQPRSGSNFIKTGRTVGGKNGVGCKIVAVFSEEFIITVVNNKQKYVQYVYESTKRIDSPIITSTNEENKVSIEFKPNWKLLKTNSNDFTEKVKHLLYKRVYDLSYLPLELTINGISLPKNTWNTFVDSHNLSQEQMFSCDTDKWKVSFGVLNFESKSKIKPISFVNNISTYDGGTHVDYITSQITDYIIANNKSINVKNFQIKEKIALFISATIPDPDFASQAKERLTTSKKTFEKDCILSPIMLKKFIKNTSIMSVLEGKTNNLANKKLKSINALTIKKVIHAQKANIKEGYKCTLFLCEGDSALTMCNKGIAAMGKYGSEYFGCFPLRGKPLNTRNVIKSRYLANVEWTSVKSIIGLEDGKSYDAVNGLRYGQVVCVKDADTDGAHIMGLIINFFENKFPSLLKIDGFLSEFISPMIKVVIDNEFVIKNRNIFTKEILENGYIRESKIRNRKHSTSISDDSDKFIIPFYNNTEFEKFNNEILKPHIPKAKVSIKYIKGLGTNEDEDIKHYFQHYRDNKLNIMFEDEYDKKIIMAFDKDLADERKVWLEQITPETYLPREKATPISCLDFIDNDLVLFSYDDCIRSIPSMVDGLKPSQRKILFTLFHERSKSEMKVTELGGAVTKLANYHHGDDSVNGAIIKMAQNYTGSNNIPLLHAAGQFGSRRQNGDDAAAPRYLHTRLADITRKIFPEIDDNVLKYVWDEDKFVEPYYYVPIIPMILANGAEGIATGWSTSIPCFNVKDIINTTRKLITEDFPSEVTDQQIRSYYNGFKGTVLTTEKGWIYEGIYNVTITETTIICNINELPVGKKAFSIEEVEDLLKDLMKDDVVKKWKCDSHLTPSFEIIFNKDEFIKKFINVKSNISNSVIDAAIVKLFRIKNIISSNNMVLFDADNKIKKYDSINDIVTEWFDTRYSIYTKRIEYILKDFRQQLLKISNRSRYIQGIIDETLNVKKVSKCIIEEQLEHFKFDRFEDSFDYLLQMPIYSLTTEKIEELLQKQKELEGKIKYYEEVTEEEIWLQELTALENYINLLEEYDEN